MDTSYFDGVDLDRPSIKHPLIEKLQANAKTLQNQSHSQLLDDDISSWLVQQDLTTKRHINEMIRHVMQMTMTIA